MLKTQPLFSFFFLASSLTLALALPVTAQTQTCPGFGQYNTCYGDFALYYNMTGYDNTAIGYAALLFNTTGEGNTALGSGTLEYNTTGYYNTAIGYGALTLNTTGNYNSAIGNFALFVNTTGSENTANGYRALYANTTGYQNTANGSYALSFNTTGSENTANGYKALYSNTTGYSNTANGVNALYSNTNGIYNTANGYNALVSNTSGSTNTANGREALYTNTTGSANTALGHGALNTNTTGRFNTGNGANALLSNTTGNNNTALGYNAGYNLTTGSNNVDIASLGVAGESGVIRIGAPGVQTKAFMAGISGVTANGGVQVFINASGQLGTLTSSKRFKSDIKDLGGLSDKLMKLRPVAFRYKDAAEDGAHPLQYGLIAEEVAKVYPELVQYDKNGKPFTVYYHLLTPLILNDLQKEYANNQQQNGKIASLEAENQALKAALKQQGIQLAALKQAQAQQFQMLSKLAVLSQANAKVKPQKAIYQP